MRRKSGNNAHPPFVKETLPVVKKVERGGGEGGRCNKKIFLLGVTLVKQGKSIGCLSVIYRTLSHNIVSIYIYMYTVQSIYVGEPRARICKRLRSPGIGYKESI